MTPIQMFRVAMIAIATMCWAVAVAVVSVFSRDAILGYRWARGWARFLLWANRCRVRVEGLENVDPSRSYVFMANHRSKADIPALVFALQDFQLRFVAKKELASIPFFGWGLRALGNIIIDRSDREQAIESYARARERMGRGISVMVFPEGTRSDDDAVLLPFKKGGFVFALETSMPIVPVAVIGAQAVNPCRSWRIWPGTIDIVVGQPVEIGVGGARGKEEAMALVRAQMESLLFPDGRARLTA